MFGLGGTELTFILGIFLMGLIPVALTVWALIDVLKNEFSGSNKLIWALVVLFLAPLGCVLYYFIGTKQKAIYELS